MMMRRTIRRSGVVALLLLAMTWAGVTACSNDGANRHGTQHEATIDLPPLGELTAVEDPSNVQGPTTAVVGGPSIAPLKHAPRSQLPVTVVSHDRSGDVDIKITDTSRVLALSLTGSLAEMVHGYGLSGSLVGRDISTNIPEAEDLPVVTKDGHSISAESVLKLMPTLIITDGSIGPVDVVLQLRDAGIPVVMVQRPVDADSSYVTMQQVADALGVSDAAPALISKLKQAIADKEAEVRQLLPADKKRLPRVAFLYMRGTKGTYFLFGEGSGVDSLLRSVGAIDVAAEIGWKGEKPMTDEALIAIDPDVLLVMTKGLESVGGVDGLLQAQPSIALTRAGKHRRIIDIEDTLLFSGGTRTPDIIDALARALYAPDSL